MTTKIENLRVITLLLIIGLFANCKQSNDKDIIDSVFKQHMQYLIDGRAKEYVNGFSKKYVKVFGPVEKEPLDLEQMENRVAESIKNGKLGNIKKFEDLFFLNAKEILNFNEYVAKYQILKNENFTLQEGDYYISYLPSDNSIFKKESGFSGFYRKENDEWKLIGCTSEN